MQRASKEHISISCDDRPAEMLQDIEHTITTMSLPFTWPRISTGEVSLYSWPLVWLA